MKISVVQLNYTIADFTYNFEKISRAMHEHKAADLIVFSELCISGYYPYDLLTYDEVINRQNQIIDKIKTLTKTLDTAVVIGAATAIAGLKKFHNSALVIAEGEIVHCYHKQLIPSYGVFDETRHFIAGQNNKLSFKFKGQHLAILICEDIWYDNHQGYLINPIDDLPQNLDALIVLNASPSMFGKFEQRLQIAKNITKKIQAPVIYSSQVGGYDELIYDGASFVCNAKSELMALADSFKEGSFSIDLERLPQAILNAPYQDNPQAFVLQQLICGLKDYVHKCGFKGVVVGSSGGIDSALTLAIATLSLGEDNVKAITMPSVYSSEGSVSDSVELCQNLGIELFTREIKEEFLLTCRNFSKAFGTEPKKLTKENMQARIRGRIVMEYSNDTGFLMLTTGNKSELAVGYATLYGDMCGALNCIGDLYKNDVYALSNYINQAYGELIPQSIIDKAPSAELSEGQKDSDSLPDYDHLDAILKLYLERDLLADDEIKRLESIVAEVDLIEQKRIYRLVELAEFKRKQAPQILFIQRRPFGMGRRMPTTAKFNK
ncbi:NAD+ synthase [Cysteiniphilum sp. QT6929]|uniref:NAD+ synthase n=1 Tax=Cysteiniphilum sp. QT6929 TaxID=2975055 RepID=UPI0024B34C14|nr:NAD+ synthase [Cysteiniphilum sp. QT6929]WHN66071.1 NAD+ synthase [Cysteiniphilum sp. QT6929]